ncbi:MAG: hypothetical protein ACJ74W_15255 [Pyrinomonadaceae bacterium]
MNALRTNTRTLVILGIFAAFALLLSACAAADNTNTTTGNANTTTTTTTTTTSNTAPTPAATTSTTTTANANTNAAPAGDKTGVEECDDYLAKYETCLNDKVPAAARAAMKTSFDQTREAWRKAAATPQGKTTLAQACKTAREAAKTSMAAYGCSF